MLPQRTNDGGGDGGGETRKKPHLKWGMCFGGVRRRPSVRPGEDESFVGVWTLACTKQHVLKSSSLQLAVMWEAKHKEEATKTEPLEEVCGELRDELDMAHKQRLDAFEIKMKPIVVREGPSRKVGGERESGTHFFTLHPPDCIFVGPIQVIHRWAHENPVWPRPPM